MNGEHDEVHLLLGAYVLGGLEPVDRSRVERHLTGCGACRDELARFASVPPLLRRVEGERGEPRLPPPTLLPRLLSAVAAERRRRSRRTLAQVFAAAAVAAVLALGGVALTSRAGPASEDVALSAVGSSAATGRAGLERRTWGTAITLDLERLPPRGSYVVWAVARDGRREQAAACGSTPSGRARLSGSTSIQRGDLARIEIAWPGGGAPLLTSG